MTYIYSIETNVVFLHLLFCFVYDEKLSTTDGTTDLPIIVKGVEENADSVPAVRSSIDRAIQTLCRSEPHGLSEQRAQRRETEVEMKRMDVRTTTLTTSRTATLISPTHSILVTQAAIFPDTDFFYFYIITFNGPMKMDNSLGPGLP